MVRMVDRPLYAEPRVVGDVRDRGLYHTMEIPVLGFEDRTISLHWQRYEGRPT